MFTDREIYNMVNYLLTYTAYTRDFILSKSDNAIFHMYNRIKSAMSSYPKDIMEFQNKLGINTYSLKQLNRYTYNALAEIRTDLKNRLKYGNKVNKNVQPEIEETYSEPILVSPDELYLSYGINPYDYSDDELFKMGYIIIDSDQNEYINFVQEELKKEIIIVLRKFEKKGHYEEMTLRELINKYNALSYKKSDILLLSELEDNIRLEKRYNHGEGSK